MNITKDMLETLWYEDEEGNKINVADEDIFKNGAPEGAEVFVSRFPNQVTTNYRTLIKQSDVNKCKHPRKFVVPTYGWIEGVVGRECKACGGTQTKQKWHLWPKKWDAPDSKHLISFNSTYSEDLVLAIANSKNFTLSEAIIIAVESCGRCMNSLAHMYGLDWGYEEYSKEWQECNTECEFCKGEGKGVKTLKEFSKVEYASESPKPNKKVKEIVKLTETTLRELMIAALKGKRQEKEKVTVSSLYSNIIFEVSVELKQNSQESLGYRLEDDINEKD